ncbi:MAG: hypothetical protein QM775_00970 [Pirellulales bacterium]
MPAPGSGASIPSDGPPPASRFREVHADKKDAGFGYSLEIVPGKWLHVEDRLAVTEQGFVRMFTLRARDELPALALDLAPGDWLGAVELRDAKGVKLEPPRDDKGRPPTLRLEPMQAPELRTFELNYNLPKPAAKGATK